MAYTTIDNPELYFQVKLYTGNYSTQSITLDGDENMQPDMVWIKERSVSGNHQLQNSLTGTGSKLMPNSDSQESTGETAYITSFDSDGFSIGANNGINQSGVTNVAWCWKESADAGFDMVTYTGSGSAKTVSHNLSAVPEFFFTKRRSGTNQWRLYHVGASDSATDYTNLDQTDAFSDADTIFNDTMPTSSVFTVGSDSGINGSSETYISFLWSGKQGFSNFSTFVGSGSTDGPFCFTGFTPAWLLIKKSSASGTGWFIFDNKRDSLNPNSKFLMTQATNDEDDNTNRGIDFLSNGFKVRGDSGDVNASGDTYIYMAFAEAPFVNSKGVPCNAR